MKQLGYYAKSKSGNFFKFQWTENNIFQVFIGGEWIEANKNNFEIIELGQFEAEPIETKINGLECISKEDYVIWNTLHKAPIETYDIVYHYTTIIELINTRSLTLQENEEIICVAELPLSEQKKYSEELKKYQK